MQKVIWNEVFYIILRVLTASGLANFNKLIKNAIFQKYLRNIHFIEIKIIIKKKSYKADKTKLKSLKKLSTVRIFSMLYNMSFRTTICKQIFYSNFAFEMQNKKFNFSGLLLHVPNVLMILNIIHIILKIWWSWNFYDIKMKHCC